MMYEIRGELHHVNLKSFRFPARGKPRDYFIRRGRDGIQFFMLSGGGEGVRRMLQRWGV